MGGRGRAKGDGYGVSFLSLHGKYNLRAPHQPFGWPVVFISYQAPLP